VHTRKMVWAEGMFLRPQHFQQQERYLESFAHARALAAHPYFWGFRTLELNLEALALGKLSINQATGIFPDGTPFNFPAHDACPPALDIAPTCKDERIYLALPMHRAHTTQVSFDDSEPLARYSCQETELADTNAWAGEPAQVQLAQMRARLIPESELTDNWLRLGVAHVRERNNDGAVTLNPHFIAPLIAYGDSRLHAMVDDIAGLLIQRGQALSERTTRPGRGGIAEVGDFMMLGVINRWQCAIAHLRAHRNLHPERIYARLLELAGELSTYTRSERRPIDYPAYDHNAPAACFEALCTDIRRALSVVLEQNAIPIELNERQYGVHVGVIADPGLFKQASFVLAVFAELPTDVVRARFPAQVKIGPVEKIRDLVNLHLPGVRLNAMPIAPRELPYHANYNYFQLDTSSELWEQLQRSSGVALHVAGDFPGLRLEFWAIKS